MLKDEESKNSLIRKRVDRKAIPTSLCHRPADGAVTTATHQHATYRADLNDVSGMHGMAEVDDNQRDSSGTTAAPSHVLAKTSSVMDSHSTDAGKDDDGRASLPPSASSVPMKSSLLMPTKPEDADPSMQDCGVDGTRGRGADTLMDLESSNPVERAETNLGQDEGLGTGRSARVIDASEGEVAAVADADCRDEKECGAAHRGSDSSHSKVHA